MATHIKSPPGNANLHKRIAELEAENKRLKDENEGLVAAADSLFQDNMTMSQAALEETK